LTTGEFIREISLATAADCISEGLVGHQIAFVSGGHGFSDARKEPEREEDRTPEGDQQLRPWSGRPSL
jgi:hypothetical protein